MKTVNDVLELVGLSEKKGAEYLSDSTILFRAEDFDAAFQRALTLGKAREQEYAGGEGARVRWRLKELLSLDILPDDLDGAELHAESIDLPADEKFDFDTKFAPESRHPRQTI